MTKMRRVEFESERNVIAEKFVEAVGTEDIQYIFVGWPPVIGEDIN